MPAQKDLKRVIRSRMAKTGESYTAARRQLLKSHAPRPTPHVPVDYDKLAGMSSEAVEAKTGCGWEKWVHHLDKVGAHTWPHGRIADYIHEKFDVPGWWTQTVTVGYERIKGLRAIGQRLSGAYEATKSRTFRVPVSKLFNAWNVRKQRAAWLDADGYAVRKATKNKAMRISWKDGESVELWFQAPAKDKSQVAVAHRKLKSKAAADEKKAYWAAQLDRLAMHLQK